jgi:hypothetical protein
VKKVDTRKVPPEIIEEFCQEAQIMRRLRHPCLTLFMGVSLEHPHLCIGHCAASRLRCIRICIHLLVPG